MKRFALISTCLLSVGCGTTRNVSRSAISSVGAVPPAMIVYGGVKSDLNQIETAVEDVKRRRASENNLVTNIATATASVVDVPFSAIGDTVTLPVTVPAAINRAIDDYYFPNRNRDPKSFAHGETNEPPN